jgi:asparagine synthase (glutamine-hydrolysing)
MVKLMASSLSHRGPDDEGIWTCDRGDVALGHRRLAILDLSAAGAQPMSSANDRFHLVFNGEIYNFGQLRAHLTQLGCRFRGTSDTEVLLAGFEAWGIAETVRRAHGMFALGVWDTQDRRLTLARDRLGEKPLYVAWGHHGVRFGSELKALFAAPGGARAIDEAALWHLLRVGYIPAPHTIWKGVTKVLPGELLTFCSATAEPEHDRYWDPAVVLPAQRTPGFTGSEQEATDALEVLLRRVIAQEMVADVPVGAFLSGGTDSSLVTALMQAESTRRVRTFTIGFHDGQFDEAPFARAVAQHLGTEHTEVMLAPDDALQFVDALPDIYDEPFADSSQLPTLLVSHTTREHVTVALSGDGGDELFSGYTQYRPGRDSVGRVLSRIPTPIWPLLRGGLAALPTAMRHGLLSRLRRPPATEPVERLDDRIRLALAGRSERQRYEDALAIWPDPDRLLVVPRGAQERAGTWRELEDYASPRMLWDTQTYLPDDICVKVDRASMHASLEVRAPLLHHEVAEFAWSLPMCYLRAGDDGKRILKAVLARHVPPGLTERPKRGFAVPLDRWLRGSLRPWGDALLSSAAPTPFRLDAVRALWQAHLAEQGNHGRQLWPVFMFLSWRQRWAP